jgi:hypothetical protein
VIDDVRTRYLANIGGYNLRIVHGNAPLSQIAQRLEARAPQVTCRSYDGSTADYLNQIISIMRFAPKAIGIWLVKLRYEQTVPEALGQYERPLWVAGRLCLEASFVHRGRESRRKARLRLCARGFTLEPASGLRPGGT